MGMEQFKPKSAEEVQKDIERQEKNKQFQEQMKKAAADAKLRREHASLLSAHKEATPDVELLKSHKEALKAGELKLVREEMAKKVTQQKEEEARTVDINVDEQEKYFGQALKEREATKWEKAKELLKRFFEKEYPSDGAMEDAEQEKLITEAMYDAKAAKFMRESPSAPDYESALKQARVELTDPKKPELEVIEIKFFEEGEMPEKIETELLSEVKRLEDSAKRTALLAKKLEKEIKEKGIDVNKMELSIAEQMKFKIKSLFDKKLRNAYKSFELARLAEDQDRTKAFELKMAVTKPGDYVKLSAQRAVEEIAMRRAEKLARSKKWSVEPPSWVKRV